MRQYGAMTPTGPHESPRWVGRGPAQVIICDADDVPRTVEAETRRLLGDGEHRTIGLATGETFRDAYRYFEQRSTLADVRCFMLDEYVGLEADHEDSFASTLRRWLPGVGGRLEAFDGAAVDPAVECARYERAIEASGPIDVQLLGVGANGHIAFNEPGSTRTSRTRVVTLTEETRERNRANLSALSAVPSNAMTQGVGTILDARAVLVVASGSAKRDPLRRLLDGPAGADVPLSWLRGHPAVFVVADHAAAG